MVHNKSLDLYRQVIAALLLDVQTSHSEVFTPRSCRLTTQKVFKRLEREGHGFLTKTLPRLAKAFDRALTGDISFNSSYHRFSTMPGSELPRFLGELFERVFSHDGRILPTPCVKCVKTIRTVLYLFYKYELPFSPDDEQAVIDKFVKTDRELSDWNKRFEEILHHVEHRPWNYKSVKPDLHSKVIHRARITLSRLFSHFDPSDIYPRHGPGVVSTKQRLWAKYLWTNVSSRIRSSYPLDAYFYVNLEHVADRLQELSSVTDHDLPAQVILVPKDSRGPRLISCEPVDFQWVQQGLSRAIVQLVERHPLTRDSVRFTDQTPNRNVALLGSRDGRYATLDLNEASDRVSLGLVSLLFPEPLKTALLNCRSSATRLPSGEVITLNKYAPMGSALCFPVLALTVWVLLRCGLPDAYSRKRVYVYGDDVIVPSAYAEHAMSILESYGLKINRDKSCTKGSFRESCGMDAFKGINVTPVRLRTVWESTPSPEVYTSWIAYANQMYEQGYHNLYDKIVEMLWTVYGPLPEKSMNLSCPSLYEVPTEYRVKRRRTNTKLQKLEYYVLDVRPQKVRKEIDGWSMLLRWYAEYGNNRSSLPSIDTPCRSDSGGAVRAPSDVGLYTKRRTSSLVRCWR